MNNIINVTQKHAIAVPNVSTDTTLDFSTRFAGFLCHRLIEYDESEGLSDKSVASDSCKSRKSPQFSYKVVQEKVCAFMVEF